MKSQRQVEREYKEMLEQNQKEVLPNRVNCYTCPSCRHITKTIDVAHGVTPMFHACEQCKTMASSSFYKDIAPDQQPTQEWFRPTLKQCMKMRKNEGLLEHILMGGLEVRKIKKKV